MPLSFVIKKRIIKKLPENPSIASNITLTLDCSYERPLFTCNSFPMNRRKKKEKMSRILTFLSDLELILAIIYLIKSKVNSHFSSVSKFKEIFLRKKTKLFLSYSDILIIDVENDLLRSSKMPSGICLLLIRTKRKQLILNFFFF